jgi:PBSX family phage terminase large subunit
MYPFSPKARAFITRRPEDDKRYNFLSGSVRSGKTFSMLAKLFLLCRYQVAGLKVIIANSKQTAMDNILRDVMDFAGPNNCKYNSQTGEFWLCGVMWLVIGAKDEGSERAIRGKTIGIAYCDECTLIPESFFTMLTSRMSPKGARLYATTNPDSPTHYLYRDYIANKDIADLVWHETFTLEDNLSLDESTRDIFRRQYNGLWKLRFIDGKWVAAEGSIYSDSWDDAQNLYDISTRPIGLLGAGGHPGGRIISVDYGTTNSFACADAFDDGRVLWIDNEFYWDSKVKKKQLTDEQYADHLEALIKSHPTRPTLIIDPSAASFALVMKNRGWHIKPALNDVTEGIKRTSSMLSRGLLRFNKDTVTQHGQMLSYAWDPRAAKLGEEKPIKLNDHLADAVRYLAYTHINPRRLMAA